MRKKGLLICSVFICLGVIGFLMDGKSANAGVLDKIVGGCGSGPCISWSECGGVGGGMGTCAYDGFKCSGNCPSFCPIGGSRNQFCLGLIGSCPISVVSCSENQKYKCWTRQFGPPENCTCTEWGFDSDCTRTDC